MVRRRLTGTRWLGAALFLGAVALPAARAFQSDPLPGNLDSRLWSAIVTVESGGDPQAFSSSGAAGIAQIREVCLVDCNRIARQKGLDLHFVPADRFDPDKARQMWDLYLSYYGDQYEKATGQPPTDEVYARIWNGGPSGWRKDSTLEYWGRVQAFLPPAEEDAAADAAPDGA